MERLDRLERLLEGARLWGVELDAAYRVAAATAEPQRDHHPAGPEVADLRVQLVFHPVSDVHAALRRTTPEGTVVETFAVEHLVTIVDSFDGPIIGGRLFDLPEPGPGEWGPELSLHGSSKALDGRAHAVTFHLDDGQGRTLDVRLTFDDVDVRTPEGTDVTEL